MADPIADALTNLKAARQQAAMAVAEAQTKLNSLDQMIAKLESNVVVIDPAFMPRRKDYEGLGMTEAAKRFLTEVGQPMTTPDLAKALLERGLVSKAKRPCRLYSTLRTTRLRASDVQRKGEEVTRRVAPATETCITGIPGCKSVIPDFIWEAIGDEED